ncbi:ROK family transcriptional regulator [Kaistia geumhonensis]|uniref:NBD/HSP70 family sugar kinase n=1 Tax=Kaistia geumhonensis TaxID=410839 RepID=A0ABU0M1B7_9HYPH|nr:ROK family transcriptional regulator [Kaistia geumhonensis]MCX5480022.1 ROK family transcriptional regulator [Kaistia geumhonensis]MDQ0514750.1 putative NBD/HSP70 family sugar kinase [Kaistia geumhonensis]
MADQTLARYVNERSLLRLLRVEGATTRADMARQLKLTPATVTRLVAEMAERGLLREVARPAATEAGREPGRPGVAVALAPDGACFLGVEIGVGVLRFALIDLAAQIVSSSERKVSSATSPAAVVAIIAAELAALSADPAYQGRIRGVGVTVPGLVTLDGFVVHLPILGWKSVNLSELLSAATDLPVLVENNAAAAAFGAVYTEPRLPSLCTIFLKLGTGLGGAAIINGRLMRGAYGTGGEFGHIRIAEDGIRCSCGQSGCLETFVNLAALARETGDDQGAGLADLVALPAAVAGAAAAGEARALAAIETLARHLARGIVVLVNIFNPTTVVLGGVMRPILPLVLPLVERDVAEHIVPGMRMPEFRLSSLGIFECAIGAATLAHQRAFGLPELGTGEGES